MFRKFPLMNLRIISVLCTLCLLFSCSTPKVISYAHASANFDSYHTYRIKPHAEVEALSRKGHETFQRLDSLIAAQMSNRGYTYSNDSDIIVDYEISSGLSQSTPSQNYNRYSYSYWYYPDYGYSAPPQEVEAMVQIEMIDTSTKKTVWTGSADLTLKTPKK